MKQSSFISRFPQFLNWIYYELIQQKTAPVHKYEPLHLHIFTPADANDRFHFWHGQALQPQHHTHSISDKDLDLESFKFIIQQVPTIQTIEFSGWESRCATHRSLT